MEEKIYLVALHKIWIDSKRFFSIFADKQNYRHFYENISFSILKKYYLEDTKIEYILKNKETLNISALEKKIKDLKVSIITYFDEDYPKNLNNIFNKPFLLYVRGNLSLPWIAFVGSRNMTSYWKSVIENFVPWVGKYFSIISGWAFWCDSCSHEVALKNGIKTISVIWTGIDKDYPVWNKKLYDSIVENGGGIISIFPLWEPWNAYNFPIRNEIVAGLSQWVVIIEAKEKSGSLITAKLALDLWKEVFAVPWDIFKANSAWTNKLILSSWAKIVLQADDILSEFNISDSESKKGYDKKEVVFNDDLEKNIYNLLLFEPLNADEIGQKLSLDISIVLLKISILELSNLIKKSISWNYEII